MLVPNIISQEETEKRLQVKHKNTNFSYYSADYGLIDKEKILSRHETKLKNYVDQIAKNPYDSEKFESLVRKSF